MDGGDGGGEVGVGGDGELLFLEDGADGGGGGAEMAVLRGGGLFVTLQQPLAEVSVFFIWKVEFLFFFELLFFFCCCCGC